METIFWILVGLVGLFFLCCGAAIVKAELKKRRKARRIREQEERLARSREPWEVL